MSSSLIHGVLNTSRAICAVVITSWVVWQPAVLGSTGTASSCSSFQKAAPASGCAAPWRRSEAVSMPGCARLTAASSVAGEG